MFYLLKFMTVAAHNNKQKLHRMENFMHLELEFHPRLTVKSMFLSKACISQLFIQNSLQWYH